MAEEVSISGGLPSIMGSRQPAIINTTKETQYNKTSEKYLILNFGL